MSPTQRSVSPYFLEWRALISSMRAATVVWKDGEPREPYSVDVILEA